MALPQITSMPLIPQEQGFPFPPHLRDPGMGDFTPNAGAAAIPHFAAFASLVNYVSRVYRYTTDEALRHCVGNALAMRNEPVIMQALRTRQMPVTQLNWHIEPEDPDSLYQKDACAFVQKMVKRTFRQQQMDRCLLEAEWYGKYAVQQALRWDFSTGRKAMICENWWPINGDKLVFKFDGRLGVLVHGTYTGSTERTDRGLAHFFTQAEREGIVCHEFEPEDADFFDSDFAGQVHGTGIRGRIYWLWWIRAQVIGWMLDYLQRIGGGGLIIAYYEHGNDASYQDVKAAWQNKLAANVMLFPRYKDNSTGGPGVEVVKPDMAGQQLLISLITEYFDQVIRRYILGTTGAADQGPSGVGEGWADLHAGEFARIVKYDAIDLAETKTKDVLAIAFKYMTPGVPVGKWTYEIDKTNVDEYLEGVKAFYDLGGQVDEDSVREVLGLPKPTPGHAVLSNIQPQAAAVPGGPAPEGVPFQGPAGPPEQGAQAGGQVVQAAPPPGQVGPPAQMSRAQVRRALRSPRARQAVKALARKFSRQTGLSPLTSERITRKVFSEKLLNPVAFETSIR
jgi:hypothetical protein